MVLMTKNADDDDHDSLVDPLIVDDNHDRPVYSLVDDNNAVDDDHDRLVVDPLVANYLAKQFACVQTNRLKYPLLQIHIIIVIIIFCFFIIDSKSHHHCHLFCCYRSKCTNFSLSPSLDGIVCFGKC